MSTETIFNPTTREEIEALVTRLFNLRQQRAAIDTEISQILLQIPLQSEADKFRSHDRPTWGPCTRCGYIWRGNWANHPPRGCARCGSTGWQVEPTASNTRHPDDPPNPRWEEKRKKGKKERKPPVVRTASTPATAKWDDQWGYQTKPIPVAETPPRVSSIPAPPKLDEIYVRPTPLHYVPPARDRFAEDPPQPERSFPAPTPPMFELQEAIDNDGSVTEEDDPDAV